MKMLTVTVDLLSLVVDIVESKCLKNKWLKNLRPISQILRVNFDTQLNT